VNGLSSHVIGQTSIPTSIIDLGNNILYIGSSQGDPCVIKIVMEGVKRTGIQVLQTFPNLGPILDFCLFDYDGQGKQTMVCCSGVDKDGSLRIVENGVGFVEHYIMEIPLITNVWSLGGILLISTVIDTTAVELVKKETMEMKEYSQYSALVLNEITLTSVITKGGYILQVTPSSVRLLENHVYGTLKSEWKPPHGAQIAVAKANTSQCVLCYGRGMLVYLDIADNVLVQKW
jgi:DNA damage-binding protein 1